MNRKELIKNASKLAAKTWCNARFKDTIQSMVEMDSPELSTDW